LQIVFFAVIRTSSYGAARRNFCISRSAKMELGQSRCQKPLACQRRPPEGGTTNA